MGIPFSIVALTGMGLAAAGDRNESTALLVVGLGCFGVAFVYWGVVMSQLTIWATPEVKAWNEAMYKGPTANKVNTVMCSVIVVGGVVMFVQEPSAFLVLFVAGAAGMLALYVRRGWFGGKVRKGDRGTSA